MLKAKFMSNEKYVMKNCKRDKNLERLIPHCRKSTDSSVYDWYNSNMHLPI